MPLEEPSITPASLDSLEHDIPPTLSSQTSESSTSQNTSQHPVSHAQPQLHRTLTSSNSGSSSFRDQQQDATPVTSYQGQAALQHSQPIVQLTTTKINCKYPGTSLMDRQPIYHDVLQHHVYLGQPSTSGTSTSKSPLKRGASSVPEGTVKRVYQVKPTTALSPKQELHRTLTGLIRKMGPKDVELFREPLPGWKGYCVYGSSAIQLNLNAYELWSKCHSLNSEMITTTAGRQIFPALSVSVTGLEPKEIYIFFLDVVLALPDVMKYRGGIWIRNGKAGEYPPRNNTSPLIYVQEDSPKSGRDWMMSGVNLTHLKITNNKGLTQTENMIFLYSMHKFIPRYHVARQRQVGESSRVNSGAQTESYELVGSFIIPGTQFYAVTVYQNPEIAKFKTCTNPFAKGFRNKVKYY